MQFSYAALAAVMATMAYSQSLASELAQLPACAATCLTNAAIASGCAATDYTCQCGPAKDAITKNVTPCLASGCQTSDILKVQQVSTQICLLAASSGSSAAPQSGSSSSSSHTTAAPSKTGSSTTSTSSSTSTAKPSSNVAPRFQVGGAMAGAAMVAAYVL